MSTQATISVRTGTARVNGAEIYYEVRGSGPSLVMISGMTGDAGHYAATAQRLAERFTVLTYDRRANSRSPRPDGWTATSIDEQADDAAALLRHLDFAPAAVFGNSGGAIIALALLSRHSEVVRRVFLHEPPIVDVLDDAEEIGAQLQTMVGEGLAAGGPAAAMEGFLRLAVGDDVFERIEPATRARMLANAEIGLGIELPAFLAFDARTVERPAGIDVVVAAGSDNEDPAAANHYLWRTSQWLANRWQTPLVPSPGAHAPYFSEPQAFADHIAAHL